MIHLGYYDYVTLRDVNTYLLSSQVTVSLPRVFLQQQLIEHNVIHHHVIQRIAGLRRLSAMQLELCPSILVGLDTGAYWAPGSLAGGGVNVSATASCT